MCQHCKANLITFNMKDFCVTYLWSDSAQRKSSLVEFLYDHTCCLWSRTVSKFEFILTCHLPWCWKMLYVSFTIHQSMIFVNTHMKLYHRGTQHTRSLWPGGLAPSQLITMASSPQPTPALPPPPGETSNFVHPESMSKWNTICVTASLAVTGTIFVLRTYVRIFIKREWILEDCKLSPEYCRRLSH